MPDPLKSGSSRNIPMIIAFAGAVLGVVIFAVFLTWDGLTFSVSVTDFASLLAPVVFAAAVVERVVEILMNHWRDKGASTLEKRLAAIKARSTDATSDAVRRVIFEATQKNSMTWLGRHIRPRFLDFVSSLLGARSVAC